MLKKIFYIKIPKNRIFGLDLLRAIAIMMVMFAHANGHQPPAFISQYLSPLLIDGVGIFFVLSGFLIGGILIRDFEKEISLRSLLNFWQRRWFRTLPNYLLILITLIILNYFFQMGFTANDYGSYFVFLQNFSSPMGSFFPESWSLSIEEWFYLITPVAIILFYLSFRRKISLKWVLLFVILLIITYSTTLRFYRYLFLELPKGYNTWDLHFMRQVATRLDALMFGVFGAWLKRYYPKIFYFKSLWFLIIGVGLTILLEIINNKMHNIFTYTISFSLSSLATLVCIPYLSNLKKLDQLPILRNIIIYISLVSYSLYLVNLSLVSIIIEKAAAIQYNTIQYNTIQYNTCCFGYSLLGFLLYFTNILKFPPLNYEINSLKNKKYYDNRQRTYRFAF